MHAKSRDTKTVERKYPAVGRLKDVDGVLWDIRDVRDTKYNFSLYFGTPANNHGSYRGGLPRLIATKPLRDFWRSNPVESRGFTYDLPAGRTTLKRLRKRLGLHYLDDLTEFWTDRLADLKSLPMRDFAARHRVPVQVALERRRQMVGKFARECDWWRTPKIRKILLFGLTLREICEKLDISPTHASRLRIRARQEPSGSTGPRE
jgi:hypothetical protein